MLVFRFLAVWYPSVELWRGVLLVADIATIYLLLKIIRHLKLPDKSVLLYALNPFVILFIVGEAHIDGLQLFAMVTALYLFYRNKNIGLYIVLGIGVLIKYWLVVLVPVLFKKRHLKFVPLFLVPFLSYLPFVLSNDFSLGSLITFAQDYQFNSLWHTVLVKVIDLNLNLIAGGILLVFSIYYCLIQHRVEKNILWIFLIAICLSSTVHPWYLLLLSPLVCLVPLKSIWVLNITMFLGLLPMYSQNVQWGVWEEFSWSVYVIWIPFYCVLIYEMLFLKRTGSQQYSKVSSLSVIIPVYNEEVKIVSHIKKIQNQLQNISHEIIVIDGNSTDQTVHLVKKCGVVVLKSPKQGRGYQIYLGIQNATKDLGVIIHADCELTNEAWYSLIDDVNARLDCAGGAHIMNFNFSSLKTGMIQFLNFIRIKYMNIAFGDQVQFVRVREAQNLNMVPATPLMEDVYLSLEIKNRGNFLVRNHIAQVSARKWQKRKFFKAMQLIVSLVYNFLIQKRIGSFKPNSNYFVKKYYG